LIKVNTLGEVQWVRSTEGRSWAEGLSVNAADNIHIHR
jgi:hypothetical protein